MPRPIKSSQTAYLTSRYDHHSYLRSKSLSYIIIVVQSYRNYSRILKQFSYGDTRFDQLAILELRNLFRIPFEC